MEAEKKDGRGGVRPGAGRPRLSESGRKQLQISLQQDEVDMLKAKAKAAGLSVSRYIAALVRADG